MANVVFNPLTGMLTEVEESPVQATALVRKPVEVKEELLSKEHKNLLKKAKEMLYYNGMAPEMELNKARTILRDMGIEPLDKDAVAAYRVELWREKNKNNKHPFSDNYFTWEMVSISNYTKPIPAFALSRALELREQMAKENIPVTFHVDELVRGSRTADPFMVMRVHNEDFYIDVWDEPKFEGRRVK